jgi:lipopolysaccharide/colanic/teichoic acid biosynthesis glycosyltransferase
MSTVATSRRLDIPDAPRDQAARPRLISEDLFRGALVRERKRADRSNRPLMVAVVRLNDSANSESSDIWLKIVNGLRATKRETDILGWLEHRSAVGLILPEISLPAHGFARDFAASLRIELCERLDVQTVKRLSVHLHIHPESGDLERDTVQSIDPLLCSPDTRWRIYDRVKRGLDIAGSLALLILLSPLFLLIAALVKLRSPGPAFYRQTRVGQMRKTFTCFKFRTMHVDADHGIHHKFVSSFIKSGEQAQEAGRKGVFKITDDPRVTRFGRILRRTSLDELPQLWNVLKGDMSLVGPRPPVPYEVEQYQPWHCRRVLEAKPGLTGLWQVSARSRTTFDEMVRLDLRYAKACSLRTDLRILLATPRAVIAGKGAC